MEYKRIRDTYYIRIDKGENLTESIKDVCKREKIQAERRIGRKIDPQAGIEVWNLNP